MRVSRSRHLGFLSCQVRLQFRRRLRRAQRRRLRRKQRLARRRRLRRKQRLARQRRLRRKQCLARQRRLRPRQLLKRKQFPLRRLVLRCRPRNSGVLAELYPEGPARNASRSDAGGDERTDPGLTSRPDRWHAYRTQSYRALLDGSDFRAHTRQ
jgi:hypothetical protein